MNLFSPRIIETYSTCLPVEEIKKRLPLLMQEKNFVHLKEKDRSFSFRYVTGYSGSNAVCATCSIEEGKDMRKIKASYLYGNRYDYSEAVSYILWLFFIFLFGFFYIKANKDYSGSDAWIMNIIITCFIGIILAVRYFFFSYGLSQCVPSISLSFHTVLGAEKELLSN
jgi:hypothetical protein